MRKLVLDLLDLIRTGQRLPHCALCDARYNDAKPFVEGATGALVCASCVRRLTDTDGVERNMYLAAHRMLHRGDADNPYSPPAIDAGTLPCLLCDELTDAGIDSPGKLSATLCDACLEHSSGLTHAEHSG